MLYFKNTELAQRYFINLRTVTNWIEGSLNGKNELTVVERGGRTYVANTAANISLIEQLVKQGKKYRPHRAYKVLEPKKVFYELYSPDQIHDIVTNIEIRREIPREYNYFDGGASRWDEYIERVERENVASNLSMTRRLLAKNQNYLDDLLSEYKKVNIIDLGVGNAFPVKDFLTHFINEGKLNRYIAVDISPEMLKIAETNVKKWFGDQFPFEGYEMDISRQRFASILSKDYIRNANKHTCNLILFIGGTLQNFRKRDIPLQVINDSMGINDLLIHTQKLDSPTTRRQFDFNAKPGEISLPSIHSLVVELLNIDPSLYEIELGYDEAKHERYEKIKFKFSVIIKINFDDDEHLINIEKGQSLLLWRASQDTSIHIINLFDRNDFYLLQTAQTEDQEYILTVSRLKRS